LFATTLILVLALHMITVNISSAGPLVCVWLQRRERKGALLAGRAGRFLAWWSLWAVLAAALTGLLAGGMLWSDHYIDVLSRLKTKIHYAGIEYLFSVALMAVYAWWWSKSPRVSRGKQIGHGSLAVLAGTNLLYHFPFFFLIVVHLAAGGPPTSGVVEAGVFRQLLINGAILTRVLHFWLACFAVTGVFLFLLSWRLSREEPGTEAARRVAVWGGRVAVVPTLLQLPIGIAVLMQLTTIQQQQVMGKNMTATLLFVAAVIFAFGLMHHLFSIALGDARPSLLARTAAMLVAVVLMMTAVARLAVDGVGATPPSESAPAATSLDTVASGRTKYRAYATTESGPENPSILMNADWD